MVSNKRNVLAAFRNYFDMQVYSRRS